MRDAIDRVLRAEWGWIQRRCKRFARTMGFDDDTGEELFSRVVSELCVKSLPAFDAGRGVKLSTYLGVCVHNAVIRHAKSIWAERESEQLIDDAVRGQDLGLSLRIHQLAQRIIDAPGRYLTDRQAVIFSAVTNGPDRSVTDVAVQLGMSRTAVYAALEEIRERLRQAIQDEGIE